MKNVYRLASTTTIQASNFFLATVQVTMPTTVLFLLLLPHPLLPLLWLLLPPARIAWGNPCGNFTSPAVSDRATPTPPGSALSDEELTYVDHSRTPTYSGVKNGLQTAIAGGKAERTVNSTKQEGLIRTCTGSTTSTIIVAS